MTHSDCSMPINNLSLSKIVDFGQVKNCVEMKKKEKKQPGRKTRKKVFR